MELTQELYEQTTNLISICVPDGMGAPVYRNLEANDKIVAYPNRESMLRAMANDKPPMVFFTPTDFETCRAWVRATFGTNEDFMGLSLHIPTTIDGREYSVSMIITDGGMSDAARRSICNRLHKEVIDLQTYARWNQVGVNSYGMYDPLHLSSKKTKAVIYAKGRDLDRLLFDPNIDWENMVLILIRSFMQPRVEDLPPYVYEGGMDDVMGYDREADDPSLVIPPEELTSTRIALLYMFILSPFYSSAQRKANQLYRRYSAAIASVSQEPISLQQFTSLSTQFGMTDHQPTNTIIDYIGRCISRDAQGVSNTNCFKEDLMTTEAMAALCSSELEERRFLVALYDSLRMVCESYNAKTLSFAVELLPLLEEAGFINDAKLNPEYIQIQLVREKVNKSPYLNMKDSIPPGTQVSSYPYLVAIALNKKEIDVKHTEQEAMWKDYNSGLIIGKTLDFNDQMYCRQIAQALPANLVVSYAQLARIVTLDQMNNALSSESDQMRNAVYHYLGRLEIPGEWYDEETKRRVAVWLKPKLDEAEMDAIAAKREVNRTLLEMPDGPEYEDERVKLERGLAQLKTAIGIISTWNEEVTARTSTNVDTRNQYLARVVAALRSIKTMIAESAEGNGTVSINSVTQQRNQM